MQRTFLQEKSLNRSLDNAEKSLNVDLSAKSKLIPYSMTADMVGLNDLYMQERDACENYRMIFTVNPICTNVLYNAVTEPVYREGSLSAITLVECAITRDNTAIFPEGTMNMSGGTSGIVDQLAAVRDTEYSHERIGDFKYHCGYDIFNNHLLRTEDFEHVRMENDKKNKDEFNTLFDFAVDHSGKTVMRILGESDGPFMAVPSDSTREPVRMYQLDNIKSINKAFYDGLRSVDGWYGFYNTGYINIPNGKLGTEDISLNKILNNEAPCGFIDMYPDRSLYSFIPKVNRYKKRIERNWDCGIVYPYKSDEDMFNRVMINFSGSDEDWATMKNDKQNAIPNAVRVLEARVVYNNVGDEMIEMHSLLRHTLQPGDEIRLFYTDSVYSTCTYNQIYRFSRPIKIVGVGDVEGNNEDRVFILKMFDVMTVCGVAEVHDVPENPKATHKKVALLEKDGKVSPDNPRVATFFYRKIENGCDDKYYFRKFKELKDYEYVQLKNCDDDTECTDEEKAMWQEALTGSTQLISEPTVITDKSPDYIKLGNDYFIKVAKLLSYTQNKIAFAENIFGDRVAQVIFNDDICISGLKDNLGRPLSTVYFVAIKTNRGYKEWYNSGITSADTVEFSHCFGEVTSGLDLPWDSAATNFNVRKIHNVFSGECQEEYLEGLMLALEDRPVGNYKDGTPLPLETGITLDDFDEFYGDIVEFSKTNFMETTIEKVYHRFNTAQRECLLNKKYYDIHYDELVGDLFDVKRL